MPPLPKREQTHHERAAEQPQDTDADPPGEEFLAEDVAAPVHGHWPHDEQCEGHEARHGFSDEGSPPELFLLNLVLLGGDADGAGDQLQVCVCRSRNVLVIAQSNCSHGFVIVVLGAESVGKDGDEDHGGEQSDNVSCQHRIVAASTIHGEITKLLLCCNEPGD